MKSQNFDYLRTAWEKFDHIRSHKTRKPSLRVRLTLIVCAELLLCVLLAWGLDALVNYLVSDIPDWVILVEFAAIGITVGALSTTFVSIYFFNPIKRLREGMERVADGDYSVTLESRNTAHEVQEVFAGFNMMTQELRSTEILQSDFVSNVSHEFKTPITAIEGYSTLLQGCEGLKDEQQEYVEKILFKTKRLSTLVGNILLLSKIENRNIPESKKSFSLDEQIRQSIVALEPDWSKKKIELDVDLESVSYFGNENLFIHVWNNLIGNAIKFSPDGGKIRIELSEIDTGVCFAVEDRGNGISAEAQKHIFDKFYQADNSHKEQGNGLGLALVKRIMDVSGGSIGVENISEGGCRFTVMLP